MPPGFIARLVKTDFVELLEYDALGFEEIVRRLGPYNVLHVVAGADSGVYLADMLADRLGIRTGNETSLTLARRDKYEMADRLARSGLAAPAQWKVRAANHPIEKETGFELPVVVKPIASAGVDNVTICHTIEQVRDALKRVLEAKSVYGEANTHAVVQECLVGQEYIVDSVSCDGLHKILMIWKVDRSREKTPYAIKTTLLHPDAVEYRVLAAYAKDVLSCLGVHYGAGHTELMLTNTGPVLIEFNCRTHGVLDNVLASTAFGTNHALETAASYVAPLAFWNNAAAFSDPKVHCMKVGLIFKGKGRLKKLPAWEKVRELDGFVSLLSRWAVGKEVKDTEDLATSPGTVFLMSSSQHKLEQQYATLRELEASGLYADTVEHAESTRDH